MIEDDDVDELLVSVLVVVVKKLSIPIDDRYCFVVVVVVVETRPASAFGRRCRKDVGVPEVVKTSLENASVKDHHHVIVTSRIRVPVTASPSLGVRRCSWDVNLCNILYLELILMVITIIIELLWWLRFWFSWGNNFVSLRSYKSL